MQNIQIRNAILVTFDDMIADMISYKKLNPTVTELFMRGRKLNILFPAYNLIMNNITGSLMDIVNKIKKCKI